MTLQLRMKSRSSKRAHETRATTHVVGTVTISQSKNRRNVVVRLSRSGRKLVRGARRSDLYLSAVAEDAAGSSKRKNVHVSLHR